MGEYAWVPLGESRFMLQETLKQLEELYDGPTVDMFRTISIVRERDCVPKRVIIRAITCR